MLCNHMQIMTAIWAFTTPIINSTGKRFLPGLILSGFNQQVFSYYLLNEWMCKMNEKANNWFCLQMTLLVAKKALLLIISFIILFSEHNRLGLSQKGVKTSVNTDWLTGQREDQWIYICHYSTLFADYFAVTQRPKLYPIWIVDFSFV